MCVNLHRINECCINSWLRRGDRKEEVQVTTKSEIEVCDNFYDVWTSHVGFGLVGGSDGKKLSSSAGTCSQSSRFVVLPS